MPKKTTRIPARKRTILERLVAGDAVAQAVRAAGIGRNEAYTWRREDLDFAAAWDDAVEEGLDMLETVGYRRAIDSSDGLLTLYLKCRRPDKWNQPPPQPKPVIDDRQYKITTVREAVLRIEQLGMRPLTIEGDYETEEKE